MEILHNFSANREFIFLYLTEKNKFQDKHIQMEIDHATNFRENVWSYFLSLDFSTLSSKDGLNSILASTHWPEQKIAYLKTAEQCCQLPLHQPVLSALGLQSCGCKGDNWEQGQFSSLCRGGSTDYGRKSLATIVGNIFHCF